MFVPVPEQSTHMSVPMLILYTPSNFKKGKSKAGSETECGLNSNRGERERMWFEISVVVGQWRKKMGRERE